ncbi:MAG: hypothetical protein JXA09_05580 [Anaerolineae bacterium]|nr:hypothetical protein [Anaerolineae bacterium]
MTMTDPGSETPLPISLQGVAGDETPPGPRSELPPTLLDGYRAEMERRQTGRALGEDRARARAFWVAFSLLAAVTVWRLVVYAVDLTAYLRLSIAGTSTQATVLRKQTEGASVEDPDRFIVTYGFWAAGSGYIRRDDVSSATFDALGIEGTTQVVYLPTQPEQARLARELVFPWRPDAVALLLVCGLLATVGRRAILGRGRTGPPVEADRLAQADV